MLLRLIVSVCWEQYWSWGGEYVKLPEACCVCLLRTILKPRSECVKPAEACWVVAELSCLSRGSECVKRAKACCVYSLWSQGTECVKPAEACWVVAELSCLRRGGECVKSVEACCPRQECVKPIKACVVIIGLDSCANDLMLGVCYREKAAESLQLSRYIRLWH